MDITDNANDSDTLLRFGETPSLDSKFEGDVNLDLHLETSFNGSRTLPSIGTNFQLDWSFGENNNNPNDPENFGNTPNIAFNNVQIDLGSFFSDFADPILKSIQEITKPIEPIAKFFTRTIEFIGAFENFSFETLFSDDVDLKFFTQILDFVNLVNSIPTDSNIMLQLGSFDLSENDPRQQGFNLSTVNPNITQVATSLETQVAGTEEGEVIEDFDDRGLEFPIIDDPETAFNLLLGKQNNDVELFTYKLPDFNIPFENTYPLFVTTLPVSLGPLPIFASAELGVKLNPSSNVEFGFDTVGLTQYKATDDVDDIFNGFFIKDNSSQPLLNLDFIATAAATVATGLPDIASLSASIESGIIGNIGLDLIDPNNDNKIRADELISAFSASALELFELEGGIDFFVDAVVKIETLLGDALNERINLIDEELLNWTVDFRDGQQQDSQKPFLATNLGFTDFNNDGILRLNIGENANLRQDRLGDIAEVYVIKHEAFTATNETVLVSSFGVVQDYKSINKIIGDAGQGDDVIELADRDVLVPAELLGGAGNDSLTGGNNDDTLIGGTGNDFLMGSAGADIHDGGEGIDTASYWNSPVGVFHDLNTGDATGDAIGDVIFDSIKGIEGSPFDDEFIDTELDRFLLGRAGNDTLIGNDGNDSLNGGEDDDLLNGGNGDDTLLGEAGDDTLDGELGLDLLNGGAGNDLLNGQEDNDTLLGEAGDDTLYGELGLDSLSGGLGNDFLDGGTENDTLLGGDLNDTLFGGDDQDYLDGEKGHDYLDGGADQDTLIGGYGRDTLMGGLDDDLLEGGGARDFLDGGEANDTLYGGDSTDLLMGRAGDDILYGGEWNDFVSGGNDNDLIFGEQSNDVLYGDDGEDTLDGGEGQDLLRGGTGQDTLLGGSGDDTLYGDDGEDTLDGEAGNDSLIGGNNDDTLRGGTGDDFLMGGAGADIHDGGEGIDTASYWNSPVGVFHDLNTGDATGDAISDVIFDSIEGIEGSPFDDEFIDTELDRFLLGRAGNDTLIGNDGDDSLNGGEDDDFLDGGTGEDTLLGGSGEDTLDGGDGNDVLVGGFDKDTLTGGQGNDQFVYQQLEDGQDLIQDFTVDQDKIVLTELFNNLGINVVDYDDAIAQGYLEFSLSAQGVDLIFAPANNLLPDTVLATVENISINELNKANNFVI